MLAVFFISGLCFLPFAAVAQKSLPEQALVIENVSVIDGVSPSVQPNKTVVIVGNRIETIGERGKVSIPKNAKIINGKGKYLIPGLWDSHVHLTGGKAYLPLFVANGVTSVREMGGDLPKLIQMREQIASGKLIGPRIKTAGTIIESEKWLNWALDMSKKDGDTKGIENLSKRFGVSSPEHAKEIVKKLAESGVDLIKVRNTHSPETFLAIINEAKKYGLPVAAHAPRMDLTEAAAGGLKSIEHTETVAIMNQDVQKTAESFAKNKTWYAPTLITGIYWRLTPKEKILQTVSDVEGKIDKRNLYVPLSVLQNWKTQLESQKNEGTFDWAAQTRKGMNEFRTMHEKGVGALAGTDFGVLLVYPGFSLHDELEALVREGGLTPFEALQSATINPAKFFDMQDEIGTIEAGKIADLVLLNANPLENISNTRKIESVILNGKYFSQADLQKLLETARAEIQKENNQEKSKAEKNSSANSNAAQNFTAQDFQNLRWLEGDWRGSGEDGKNPFYERYSFVGDDRIEMQSFTDAAMTQPGSEKSVTLVKDGVIYHQAGRGVWVADKLSKTEISFVPKENVRNSFIWKMESRDVWTAEINFTNQEGKLVRNIYRLERIKK